MEVYNKGYIMTSPSNIVDFRINQLEKSSEGLRNEVNQNKSIVDDLAANVKIIADKSTQNEKHLARLREHHHNLTNIVNVLNSEYQLTKRQEGNKNKESQEKDFKRWETVALICLGAVLFAIFTMTVDPDKAKNSAIIGGTVLKEVLNAR